MSWLAVALIVSLGTPEAIHEEALSRLNAGRYGEVEKLCRDAIPGFAARYGQESLEVALVLGDMAAAYRGERNLTEAEKAARLSLAMVEKGLGPEDANTALALDQLAEIYFDGQRYAEAGRLLRRALAAGEQALGPEHPHVLVIRHNLDELERAWGERQGVVSAFRR